MKTFGDLVVGDGLMYWVLPLSGWGSSFVILNKDKAAKYLKVTGNFEKK